MPRSILKRKKEIQKVNKKEKQKKLTPEEITRIEDARKWSNLATVSAIEKQKLAKFNDEIIKKLKLNKEYIIKTDLGLKLNKKGMEEYQKRFIIAKAKMEKTIKEEEIKIFGKEIRNTKNI
jgi:hypothetical protein